MTNIKFNVTIDNSCILSILDVTGYQPDNLTGFISPSLTGAGYKLNEGYFQNIIQYNKHRYGPVIVNTTEPYTNVDSPDIVYANNFTTQKYNLAQDGVYTINRVFVISKEIYDRDKTTDRFNGLVIYYSDGVDLYKVTNNVAAKTTIDLLLKDTYPSTASITAVKIISTCFMNACYFKLMSLLLDSNTVCDTDDYTSIRKERDLLFMVLECIKYLKEQGSIQEIEKLIEGIDACGGICSRVLPHGNCGCNG